MELNRVQQELESFWSVGGDVHSVGAGTLVQHSSVTHHPLGNFVCRLNAQHADEVDSTLAAAEHLMGRPCRRMVVDGSTSPVAEAQLVMRDWQLQHQLQLVLDPEASIRITESGTDAPIDARIVPVRTTGDWQRITELFRLDHAEEDRKAGRRPRPEQETGDAVRLRWTMASEVQYFLAQLAGDAVG